MIEMTELAKIVERCQRNFDTTSPLPNKHVKQIINACTSMPTKNNVACYDLFVLEDRNTIEYIFKNIAYAEELYTNGSNFLNGQVNAPLLLIWSDAKNPDTESKNDLNINVGISSGAAALAAASLGYKTGFCKCFVEGGLKKVLKNATAKKSEPLLMLGIGHPNPKADSRLECMLGDERVAVNKSRSKNIRVFRQHPNS